MKTKILISIVHFIKNSRHTNIAHKNKYICSTKIKKNKKKDIMLITLQKI